MTRMPAEDERLADWVDGRMTPRERERFEAELRVNSELRAAAERYRELVTHVQGALQGDTAPADLTDRVMARLDDAPPKAAVPAPQRLWPLLGSVLAAAALFAVWFLVQRPATERMAPSADRLARGDDAEPEVGAARPAAPADGGLFADAEAPEAAPRFRGQNPSAAGAPAPGAAAPGAAAEADDPAPGATKAGENAPALRELAEAPVADPQGEVAGGTLHGLEQFTRNRSVGPLVWLVEPPRPEDSGSARRAERGPPEGARAERSRGGAGERGTPPPAAEAPPAEATDATPATEALTRVFSEVLERQRSLARTETPTQPTLFTDASFLEIPIAGLPTGPRSEDSDRPGLYRPRAGDRVFALRASPEWMPSYEAALSAELGRLGATVSLRRLDLAPVTEGAAGATGRDASGQGADAYERHLELLLPFLGESSRELRLVVVRRPAEDR